MTLNLSDIKSRQYRGDEDLPALVDLINKAGSQDGENRYLKVENVRQFLKRGNVEPPQLWENSDGELLRNVTLLKVVIEEEEEKQSLEVRILDNVSAEARGQDLEDSVMAWCLERAGQLGEEKQLPTALAQRINEDKSVGIETLKRNRFEIARFFFTMENPLTQPLPSPELPEGFTIINGAGPADPQAWADLYNLSFIDHYRHHHMTLAEVEHENKNPDYNPELDLVVIGPDGTWAALCYAYINPGEKVEGEQIGWIGLLGTRRGYRNRGIGRAAILSGMHLLQKNGSQRIRLHVDADSLTGATHLYEAVGFGVVETALHYSRQII